MEVALEILPRPGLVVYLMLRRDSVHLVFLGPHSSKLYRKWKIKMSV